MNVNVPVEVPVPEGTTVPTPKGVLPEGKTAYKACKDGIVTLIVPEGAQTNESRRDVIDPDFAKYRADSAYVVSITCPFTGTQFSKTSSYYETAHSKNLKYKVGEMTFPHEFDPVIEKVCTSGVHYFKTYEAALYYFIYQIYKDRYLVEYKYSGKYCTFKDNGQIVTESTYEYGVKVKEIQFNNGTKETEQTYRDNTLYQTLKYNSDGTIINNDIPEITSMPTPKGKIAYKACKDGIVTLIIPEEAQTNESRTGVIDHNFAKFRAECAYVISITCPFSGKQFSRTTNFVAYDSSIGKTEYVVGQLVFSKKVVDKVLKKVFDQDINKVCASGIHYFHSYEAALYCYYYFNTNVVYNGYSGKWCGHDASGQKTFEQIYENGSIIKDTRYNNCVKINSN